MPWTDVETRRFTLRQQMFVRRGMGASDAERCADRLVQRDQDKDDRRMCIECKHLQEGGTCFVATQGRLRATSTKHQPIKTILQRCEAFAWAVPRQEKE